MKSTAVQQPKSIAARLVLFSSVFVTLAILVASVILWVALNSVIREQVDQRLDTQIAALATALKRDGDGKLSLSNPLDAPPFDRPGSGWYWQIDSDDNQLASRSLLDGTIEAPPPRLSLFQMLTATPTPGEGVERGRRLYLRQSSRYVDGHPVMFTATAPMAALVDPAIRALLWLVPSMLCLGLALLVGTVWQVRFGLAPLKTMADDIEAINRGERARVPSQATAELLPLAMKTNELLKTNEDRLAATRIQFANLAHGLKTPIASLSLALSDANDPDGSLRDVARRLESRIKHHLSDARRIMTSSGIAASTDVGQAVSDIQKALRRIYAEREIAFEADVGLGLSVACEESDVEEMLGNLLDNAFKWAATLVAVSASREGPFVRIVIADDGPGIPHDRLDAVLEAGVREDERMPGDGFGLSIVTELTGLYGGSFRLRTNAPTGLCAVLDLPAAVGRTHS
ncbi:sensor histidine kinase [Rhizobium sp. NPDC090275]|uniref:sensor histidine kinase n=1 Tax=Rhizobium sp. NPDC090275 TaxID=3364498 RepID=UPI00383B354C